MKTLRKTGKRPVILLSPGQEVRREKSKEPHRKYPVGYDYLNSYIGKRGKNKPRCLARGCQRMLRVNQPAVCSEACENRVINDAILRLKMCRVSKEQLLVLYE